MKPNDSLSQIDHVVVLMLENRSFDNILGHLYGVGESGQNRLITLDGEERTIESWSAPGQTWPQVTIPAPDPGEAFVDMNQQIFGLTHRPDPDEPEPEGAGSLGAMGGFAQNYQRILRVGEDGDHSAASNTPVRNIMNFFDAEQVPVSSALAQAFRVVDTYHASAPCQTMPNRAFAQLGTANGWVNNSDAEGIPHAPYFGLSIFGQFRWARHEGKPVDWRCYFGDFPLTLAMVDTWAQFDRDHFRRMDRFEADAAAGELPAFTWIEPSYQIEPNDNHPPHDVTRGEALLATVYNALRASPQWEKTLFVLTYDEHGGTYDRRSPGRATPPGGSYPDGFRFDRYGVRVPCILMSDYTLQAGVGGTTGPLVFDHTSLLTLLRERFDLGEPLSQRDAAARSLGELLGPRGPGAPASLPVPQHINEAMAIRQQAVTDAAELVAAKLAGASWDTMKTMFVNDLRTLADLAVSEAIDPYLQELLDRLYAHIPSARIASWLSNLDDHLLALARRTFEPHSGRFLLEDLGQLVTWLAQLVVRYLDEHRRTPLTMARIAEIRAELGAPAGLQRPDAVAAINEFWRFLEAQSSAATVEQR